MSSSQNSENTYSCTTHEEVFNKFDMTFTLRIKSCTRPKWDRVTRFASTGEVVDPDNITEAAQHAKEHNDSLNVNWEKSDEILETKEVEAATFSDLEEVDKPKYIELCMTTAGYIMGIAVEEAEDTLTLLDPCYVQYRENCLNYEPVFGVNRKLPLNKTVIIARMPPSSLMLASYPGFILQNRALAYDLKPLMAYAKSPEATNDSEMQK